MHRARLKIFPSLFTLGIAGCDAGLQPPANDATQGDADDWIDGGMVSADAALALIDAAVDRTDARVPRDAGADAANDAPRDAQICASATGTWAPVSGATTTVTTVWGSGANDVWSVAGASILHWDGATWTPADPGRGVVGFAYVGGIWGRRSDDVYAVGTGAYHWDGTAWTYLGSSSSSFFGSGVGTLRAIDGQGDQIWIVGDSSQLVHFDGAAWSRVPSGISRTLSDVAVLGAADAWAVGALGTSIHWNGTAWAEVDTGSEEQLLSVSGTPSSVWAVGTNGAILRWTGSTWTRSSSGVTAWLHGVWAASSSEAWAVGDRGTLLHFDGCGWSSVASGTTSRLVAIWGSSPTDIWAVGDGGTLLHYGPT